MAFTGLINREIGNTEGPGTASAHLRTWLNTVIQKDGTDYRLNLSQDGVNYIRWNTVSAAFEFYINNVLQGHVSAASMAAD